MLKNRSLLNNEVICFVVICCSGFSFLMPFRIFFIGIFAALMLVYFLQNRRGNLMQTLPQKFIVLFTGLIFFSVLNSYDRIETLKYFCIYVAITFLLVFPQKDYFHLKVVRITQNVTKIVAVSIIVNLLIPNLYTKYLYFLIRGGKSSVIRVRGEISNGIYSGLMGEKSEAAFIMVLAIILLLGECAALNRMTKKNKIWLCMYLIALLLPAKRMLFAIGLLICFLYLLFWTSGTKKFKTILGFTLLGIVGLVIVLNIPAFGTLANRFFNGSGYETGNGRVYLWEYAQDMFMEKPILGYGYGSFNAYSSDRGVILTESREWVSHAHNIYYQLLAETGIVGTCIFLAIALWGVWTFYKLYKIKNRMSIQDVMLLFVGGNIQLMVLIYGYSGNIIYYSNQVMVYFWGIGLMEFLTTKYVKHNRADNLFRGDLL